MKEQKNIQSLICLSQNLIWFKQANFEVYWTMKVFRLEYFFIFSNTFFKSKISEVGGKSWENHETGG